MSREKELENIFGIYIELDCLFDTRLGTLALLDEQLATAALDNNYLAREQDVFPHIKKETFKKLYELRDVENLRLSPITTCFKLLNDLVHNTLKIAMDSPDCTGCKIFLNIHPYKLSEEEVGDMLELVVTATRGQVEVEIISASPEQLTVDYCDRKFVILVMYDYNAWLEANVVNGSFKKKNMTDAMLIGPKLYLHKVPTAKDLKQLGVKGMTPFKAVTMLASSMIRLELMNVDIFSVDLSQYVKPKPVVATPT